MYRHVRFRFEKKNTNIVNISMWKHWKGVTGSNFASQWWICWCVCVCAFCWTIGASFTLYANSKCIVHTVILLISWSAHGHCSRCHASILGGKVEFTPLPSIVGYRFSCDPATPARHSCLFFGFSRLQLTCCFLRKSVTLRMVFQMFFFLKYHQFILI